MDLLQIQFGRHSDGRHRCWCNLCSFHTFFHLQYTRPSPDTLNREHLQKFPQKSAWEILLVYSPYQNLFCVPYILSRIRMSVPGCRHRCWCICCGCHNTQTRPTIAPRSKSSGTIPIYPLRQGQIEKGKEDTHRNHHPIRVNLSGAPPFEGVFPESNCDHIKNWCKG